jgi:hypothetical protein
MSVPIPKIFLNAAAQEWNRSARVANPGKDGDQNRIQS